jgi:uncharacterized protein (DUF433 family)
LSARSLFIIHPSAFPIAGLAGPVVRRRGPGGSPAIPRRVPGVDHEIPFICRASIALFASSALGAAIAFRFDLTGTPVFKGTRVPVKTLFDYLADRYTLDEFLACFPSVTREVARRALERSESALLDRAAA